MVNKGGGKRRKKSMKYGERENRYFFFPSSRGESTNGRVNDRMKSVFSLCLTNNSDELRDGKKRI